MEDHPCDGVWFPLGALRPLATGPRDRALGRLTGTFTGVRVDAGSILRGEAPSSRAMGDLALWVDLERDAIDPGTKTWRALLDAEPDVVAIRPPRDRTHGGLRPLLASAAEHELALALDVRVGVDSPDAVAATLAGLPGALAVSVDRFDEDMLDVTAPRDAVAALVGGDEFATAYRRGATAFCGLPALFGPAIAERLAEVCEASVQGAIDLERRLLRFLEGPLERTVREQRIARETGVMALGGWLPAATLRALDATSPATWARLRTDLTQACPELSDACG